MTTPALRRRGKPNDLKNTGEWFFGKGNKIAAAQVVHDRTAALKFNSDPVAVEIDDPYGLNFGDKIVTMRERRGDPLAKMRSDDHISECDYRAGRHWQDAFEMSQIGSIRAIDPSKEAVDGGRPPEMLTDRQRKGAADVDRARVALGPVGDTLLRDVLGEGLSITKIAALRGIKSERERRFLGARFRECLGTLAVLYGLAMKKR